MMQFHMVGSSLLLLFALAFIIGMLILPQLHPSLYKIQAHTLTVLAGGITVTPAMRPWLYLGTTPNSRWDSTRADENPPKEIPLLRILNMQPVRIQFP